MGLLVSPPHLGAAVGVLASVLGAIGAGVALLAKLLFALLSPIGLVIAGVTALGSYLLYTSGIGGEAPPGALAGGSIPRLARDSVEGDRPPKASRRRWRLATSRLRRRSSG